MSRIRSLARVLLPIRLRMALRKYVLYPLAYLTRPVRRVSANGNELTVDVREAFLGRKLWFSGLYEPEIGKLIAALSPHLQGKVALDIGANVGLHTVAMMKAVGPDGHVYAVEPEAQNFRSLTRNVQRHDKSVTTLLNTAAGDREGAIGLRVNRTNPGDQRVTEGPSPDGTVPLNTMDALVQTADLARVRFIKIDVQGYEAHVLRGMRRILEANPSLILVFELWPEGLRLQGASAVGLIGSLVAHGFTGYEITTHRATPLLSPEQYAFFGGVSHINIVVSRKTEPLTGTIERLYRVSSEASSVSVF